MKTRVLVVTDYFYPHWTGISKSIYNLTQALQNQIDFTVGTVNYSGELKTEEVIGLVKVLRTSPLLSFSRAKLSLMLIIKMFNLVNQHDCVLINSPSVHILPVSLIAKIFNKKLIFFHQGDIILPSGLSNRIIEKLFDISTIISFFLGNKVSTYTRDYAQYSRILKAFLHKFTPLIPPIFVSESTDSSVLKKLENLKKQNKTLIGFGGRFVEEKGFDILFKAIPSIAKKYPRVHFVFAGKVNMEYENFFKQTFDLYSKVKEHITILGLLQGKELMQFYKSIDFVVIPSRSDCFPLFQAEAMLSGVPSIVSDIHGARYLVMKTGFGLIFKKENESDLANKIGQAIIKRVEIKKNYLKVREILDTRKNAENFRKYFTE